MIRTNVLQRFLHADGSGLWTSSVLCANWEGTCYLERIL
jgi:hypothetical protein